jgi:hypothetical protein
MEGKANTHSFDRSAFRFTSSKEQARTHAHTHARKRAVPLRRFAIRTRSRSATSSTVLGWDWVGLAGWLGFERGLYSLPGPHRAVPPAVNN